MLCPDEGLLRAYVDRELPARQGDDVGRHLAGCAHCRDRLAEVERAASLVRSRLALLAPNEAERPTEPALALAALRHRVERRPSLVERLRRPVGGLPASLAPARAAAAAVAIALVAALSFQPVRLAAQDLLAVFRVQQVTAVQIDPSMLPSLPEPEDLGTVTMTSKPEFKTSTLADAGRQAGLTPRTITRLPAGFASQPSVMVSQPLEGSFTYDLKKLEAYYQKRGIAGKPPAELGGLTIKGSAPSGVMLVYGDQQALAEAQRMSSQAATAKPQGGASKPTPGSPERVAAGNVSTMRFLALGQVRSPRLEVPGNVDVKKLRQEMLKSGAVPPELAAQLAAIEDWQNTLPVPVLKGTSRDVTVDGAHGVLVTNGERERAVIWQRGDVVYGLFGSVSEAELLAAANSLSQ